MKIEGIDVKDPSFNMEATWIEKHQQSRAESLGYMVVEPEAVIATHLNQILNKFAHELIGQDDIQALLDNLSKTSPQLVSSTVPKIIPLSFRPEGSKILGEKTKASLFGWTKDQKNMYFQSNSRNSKYFDLYKINIETLETKMVFQNDMAYSYNSISENDRYLVFELSISRNEDKMFLYDFVSKEKIEISNEKANYSGQGFDKNDENYYYTTNYEGEFYYLMSYNISSGERDLIY